MMRAVVLCIALLYAAPADAGTLLNAAKRYTGLHERTNNATLRKMLGVNPAAVKWCGYFVGAVVRKLGGKVPAGYPRAISWRNAGRAVTITSARAGDVVVMRNHVTIYTRRSGSKVCGIGGNQGNKVRESCYPTKRVVAVRRVM